MQATESALDILALLRLPGVGPQGAIRALGRDIAAARASDGFGAAREQAALLAEECADLGIGIVGWFDPGFPARLKTIPDPPAILYLRGALAAADNLRSVAVVGTREPSEWGKRTTRVIADRFTSEGWVVVSGLALGVDTIAHERALAANTPTVAVLGNGLASVYPAANRKLAEAITEAGGLLLAEVPPRARVEPRQLVKRDRLQSGLAALTVICQGGTTSGAMHTARYAAEQGRPVYCAALPRDGVAAGSQDEGTDALLHIPASRLPDLLPAWKNATRRITSSGRPVALPLDARALETIEALAPSVDSPRAQSATLF
jgi:DNA processing protein